MSFAGIRRWARTGSGAIIPTVEVEVRFRNDDGTAGGLATIYSDNQGNTGITQPGFTAGADGSFELYAASGQYIIVVGSGASQESVPIDIVNANQVLQFDGRAAFVAWRASGYIAPDGSFASDGTVLYVASAAATSIADLNGWLPFGVVTPLHFASNATPGVTDMTDAINAALTYLRSPDETNMPGGANYKRYEFRGRTLDLKGQQYLVSDELRYQLCHGLHWKDGTIIADTASANWATNKGADADAALISNKGSFTSNCTFENITVECNEVINGIYCDRNVRGEFIGVQVYGFWNQLFGIKADQSPSPGTPFASNLVWRDTKTFGTIAGEVQNLSAMPTGQGIICHNGDVQIFGGESIRCLRGVWLTGDGIVSNWHSSPFVVDLTATASVTNGSPTVTVTDAANIEVNDLLQFGTDPGTQYSVQGVSGTTITLASNFAGTTDAATSMALSKHDAEGIRGAPFTGTGPINQQFLDNYFDQTVLAIHPRYKTIVGNQFRKVSQPGPWVIKMISLQASDPIVGVIIDGNLADIRRGEKMIEMDGSFASEVTDCKFGENIVRDDVQELPIGLNFSNTWTPVVTDGTNNATSTTAEGSYYRSGRRVDFGFTITLSSLGSVSGATFVDGLPFTSSSGDGQYMAASTGFMNSVTLASGEVVTGIILPNSTRVTLYRWGTSGTVPLQATNLSNTTGLRMSGFYYTD